MSGGQLLGALGLSATLSFAFGWVTNEILDDRPFFNTSLTCGPNEVAVWEDWPDTYNCVSNTDHEAHQEGARHAGQD